MPQLKSSKKGACRKNPPLYGGLDIAPMRTCLLIDNKYIVPELSSNAPFCSISASGVNYIPRNTKCMPVVIISAFLELE